MLFDSPSRESENYVDPSPFQLGDESSPSEVFGLSDTTIVNPEERFNTVEENSEDSPLSYSDPVNFNGNQIDNESVSYSDPIELVVTPEENQQPDVDLEDINTEEARFSITRFNPSKDSDIDFQFYFSMLPAIRTDSLSNSSINLNDTPGATEGLSILTRMRYKNRVTPGGHPVVDGIGLDSKVIRLVGAFTGWDSGSAGSEEGSAKDIPLASRSDPNLAEKHSYQLAKKFSKSIVEKGGEVKINIKDNTLKILLYAVIVSFQIYVVREELTYYHIDCLVTRY